MRIIIRSIVATVLIVAAVFVISCAHAGTSAPAKASSISEPKPNLQSDEFAVNKLPLRVPLVEPKIVVSKSKRRLMLYSDNKLVRTYRVGLGLNPTDDKVREGDRRTPEGEFYIFTRNAKSAYYLSLGVSYPNAEDAERGLRDGLINREQHDQILNAVRGKIAPPQNTPLGGQIYIHGNGSRSDWTWGCVALDDKDMKELFDAVPVGTQVIIEH